MKIVELRDGREPWIEQLVDVWESAVKATHLFLSEGEIGHIKQYVPQALREVPVLLAAMDDSGSSVGFMGVADGRLEMLFLSQEHRGKGLGKRLLHRGIEEYGVTELSVNEENHLARGFYEYMGFQTYRRTELDEQGNPYPLLYMKRT